MKEGQGQMLQDMDYLHNGEFFYIEAEDDKEWFVRGFVGPVTIELGLTQKPPVHLPKKGEGTLYKLDRCTRCGGDLAKWYSQKENLCSSCHSIQFQSAIENENPCMECHHGKLRHPSKFINGKLVNGDCKSPHCDCQRYRTP